MAVSTTEVLEQVERLTIPGLDLLGGEFTVITVDVTPQIAAYWLAHNVPNNRGEKRSKVPKYARDMGEGNWRLTGDTVQIAPDGFMIDGGQRMRAVCRVGGDADYPNFQSVRMAFAFNVDRNAMPVIDTGTGRTFADVLLMEEAVNRTAVGAIVRRIFAFDQGNFTAQRGSSSSFRDPTMTELLELYKSDSAAFDAAAARGMDVRVHGIGNSTAAGTAYYVLSRVDASDANNFFDSLISGANLPAKSPIHVLRERLRRADSKIDQTVNALTPNEQLYLYVRAWNNYRRDIPIEKLQLPDGRDVTNAKFPRPV